MNETLLIVLLAVWYLIGLYSFYFWWRKDCDITTDPEILCMWFAVGFFGVFTWFIGKSIHTEQKPIKYRTLFKKKE